MKKNVFTLLTAVFISFCASAQTEPCGYDQLVDSMVAQNPGNYFLFKEKQDIIKRYREANAPQELSAPVIPNGNPFQQQGYNDLVFTSGCRKPNIVIPVVVHIIHDINDSVGTGSNISNAQVQNAIDGLNDIFANVGGGVSGVDTKIQFCLAKIGGNGLPFNGITRNPYGNTDHLFQSEITSLQNNRSTFTNGEFLQENYLNIYVVRTILDDNGVDRGVYGYAFMPGGTNDGIVIRHDWFGNAATCTGCNLNTNSRNGVLAHEAGHYLGLEHTFKQGCTDKDNCSIQGDLCCDTPPCTDSRGCDTTKNTCTETYNGNLKDMVKNHMSYSDESCRNTFTQDQTDIMYAVLLNKRSTLISPENVNAKQLTCCNLTAYFDAEENPICNTSGDSAKFTAHSYTTTTAYKWQVYNGTTLITVQTTALPNFAFLPNTTPASYTIKLTIYNGGDSNSYTRTNYMEVLNCGSPLPSTQGNWYFGEYGGLKFTTQGVIRNIIPFNRKPNAINTSEGVISQSNSYGAMLFHGGGFSSQTDSFQLFGKNYLEMPNSPIKGDGSSSQGGVIVPVPGNGRRFYIFTATAFWQNTISTEANGLYYSIIDTTLNGGNGDVDTNFKNIPVKAGGGGYADALDSALLPGELLTAIPKCNGTDYWLLVSGGPDPVSDPNNYKRPIYIYSITGSGISYHGKSTRNCFTIFGAMKASPDGSKVAVPGLVFAFDRVAGTLTEFARLDTLTTPYGLTFSPNSKLLYISRVPVNPSVGGSEIYQYDLQSNTPEVTKKYIGLLPSNAPTQMQLGPDNKIYIGKHQQTRLAVIEKPDSLALGNGTNECGYEVDGPFLAKNGFGGTSYQGLPNFVDAKNPSNVPLDFTYIVDSCQTISLFPVSCGTSYSWNFGDGDTSSAKYPIHTYDSLGNYTVQLTTPQGTVSKTIRLLFDAPLISGDTLYCDTAFGQLYSVGNPKSSTDYVWSAVGGTLIPEIDPEQTRVKWFNNGTVSLQAKDLRTGCVTSAVLSVRALGTKNIYPTTQKVCFLGTGETIYGYRACTDSTNISYTWQKAPFSNPTSWSTFTSGTGVASITANNANFSASAYVRRIRSYNGLVDTSNIVQVILTYPGTIDAPPTDQSGNVGDTIKLYPQLTNAKVVKWQVSVNSSAPYSWNDIPNSQLDTLRFNGVQKCLDGLLFRALVNKFCHPDPIAYTDSAAIIISGPGLNNNSDLWIKDYKTDVGIEPFNHWQHWVSPDIWINDDTSNFTTNNEVPVYDTTMPNKIFVKVRNRGTDTSKNATLFIYWSKSNTAAAWEWGWSSDSVRNSYINSCSDINQNKKFPLGGKINATPITIPPIPPGDSATLGHNWTPPNPFWYCKRIQGLNVYDSMMHTCVLARIQTCDIYPFGMTFPEEIRVVKNILNNNNIASLNSNVINRNGILNPPDSTVWSVLRPSRTDSAAATRLVWRAGTSTFYDTGYVILLLDSILKARWQAGGSLGTGFTLIDSSKLKVSTSDPVYLENILLKPWDVANIGIQFKPFDTTLFTADISYEFNLVQYDNDTGRIVGGNQYLVNIPIGTYWSKNELSIIELKEKWGVNAYPNPFTNDLTVAFELDNPSRMAVELMDLTGRTVMSNGYRDFNKGYQSIRFNTNALAAGVYLIRVFSINGEQAVIKVVLNK